MCEGAYHMQHNLGLLFTSKASTPELSVRLALSSHLGRRLNNTRLGLTRQYCLEAVYPRIVRRAKDRDHLLPIQSVPPATMARPREGT